jgi:acetoin utilization deacetylase AcuC-like enzyme
VARLVHRLRRLLGPPALSLVFDDRYARAVPGVPIDPARGAYVLAFLVDRGLVPRDAVSQPIPTSLRNILRVHTPRYVETLQDPATVGEIFGMAVTDTEAQGIVELQRLVAGGTIQATRLALATRRPAAHLGGGFHHAAPDRGMGFCVFNDVAVAVQRLRAKGFRQPVLVVDLDVHHGNGTRAAFAADATVHTYSIHNVDWDDRPAVASTDIALGSGVTDDRYLDVLRDTLPAVLAAHRPGFVVYVAGADPAADDALGDWKITRAGMLERDRFVVEQVRAAGAPPLVIVLGGGYGYGAWRYTARFLSWLAGGTVIEPPDDMDIVLHRFRPLARTLSEDALRAAERAPAPQGEWSLTAEDLGWVVPAGARETRVLGHYSRQGLELLFERLGVLERLRALGYRTPVVDVVPSDGLGPTVRVFGEPERRNLVIELRVARNRRLVPGCEVAFVEWLLLQDPRSRFGGARGPLPGQQHPGLGMMGLMAGTLVLACDQAGLDGVANVPSQYYLAFVGRHHLRFVDPAAQGRFEALHEALRGLPLRDAERALAEGRVVDAAGRPVRWQPAVTVMPVSERLRVKVEGPDYDAAVAAARGTWKLRLVG